MKNCTFIATGDSFLKKNGKLYHPIRCVKCGFAFDSRSPPEKTKHPQCPVAGLGDAAAYVFRKTGIAWGVKKVRRKCGCGKRQHALNRFGAAAKKVVKDMSGWSAFRKSFSLIPQQHVAQPHEERELRQQVCEEKSD